MAGSSISNSGRSSVRRESWKPPGTWWSPPPPCEGSVKINSDFRDLLRNLNGAGVQYLVVGGYAVMVHTEPRYTKDLDLWIKPELKNAQALLAALLEFGAPIADVTPEDFTEPEIFFQIGVDPVRVDILTSVLGL